MVTELTPANTMFLAISAAHPVIPMIKMCDFCNLSMCRVMKIQYLFQLAYGKQIYI